ncbi:uncharacterized protein RanBP3 isoform X1 [Bemisia tabaci]|uniref:uncharacterized protein RanBP3 isoform X1 n=1 Tax=Bemisia tabaci TaxID=7038 RepID=UPI0008F9C7B0|nr:PREDICTED: ran-binding protein 3 isoform X1 [Bemisia tabaci]
MSKLQENNSTEEPNSTTSSKDSTPEAVATSSGDISIEVSQDESSSSDTCSKFPKSDDTSGKCTPASSDKSTTESKSDEREEDTSSPSGSECTIRPAVPFRVTSPHGTVTSGEPSNPWGKSPAKPILQPSLLAKPKLNSFSGEATASLSPFVLNPPKLQNPFAKSFNGTGLVENVDVTSSSEVSSSGDCGSKEKGSQENKESKVSSSGSSHVFVPLATAPSTVVQTTPIQPATPSRFVFGQNLHERVAIPQETTEAAAPESSRLEQSSEANASSSQEDGNVASKTNGTTSQMLFSSVLQKESIDNKSNETSERKSLSEAAREYEEARAVKRKYEEVQVVTGEEEESNVLQINCKLFAFNNENGTWTERGRGTLRVNDKESGSKLTSSRVVVRTVGNLRVVLNTKIWSEMTIKKSSEKSVQITAMDNSGLIKIFLIMASPKDADQLYKALEWRVSNQKKLAANETVSAAKKVCPPEKETIETE